MSKTVDLDFTGDEQLDTEMLITEFIEVYGSGYKEKILALIVKDLKFRDALKIKLDKETDPVKKGELRQKHTNIKYDLNCYLLALRKVYKREAITLELIEETWSTPSSVKMTAEEYEIAMVDIGLQRTWDNSRILDKTPEKKKQWDILKQQIEEGHDRGYGLDIPSQ